jgi:hypothetical protein
MKLVECGRKCDERLRRAEHPWDLVVSEMRNGNWQSINGI